MQKLFFTLLILALTYSPTFAEINPPREFEPNGSIATATSVTLGGSELRGDLSSVTDKDYFKFTSTGGVVQFTGRPATVVNYSSSGFKMSILDSTGNLIRSNLPLKRLSSPNASIGDPD
jgi:hypothetical protein